jgi:bile acid:Na+ symporter, BASS family
MAKTSRTLRFILTDRNSILVISLLAGLVWDSGAQWTEKLVLPGLIVIMTVSMMDVSARDFVPFSAAVRPFFLGTLMNYGILTSAILILTTIFIRDPSFRIGFILMAAAPPAVAVIPFTFLFKGDVPFSLAGTMGGYTSGLLLTPLITLLLVGPGIIDPGRLAVIMVELIVIPVAVSRLIAWTGANRALRPVKGLIVNWSFFLLSYTIIGLNRDALFREPALVLASFIIAFATTIPLALAIEFVGRRFGVGHSRLVALVLLGTLKNYGVAGGLALTLFEKRTAMPATVASVFMVIYVIYLDVANRRRRTVDGRLP